MTNMYMEYIKEESNNTSINPFNPFVTFNDLDSYGISKYGDYYIDASFIKFNTIRFRYEDFVGDTCYVRTELIDYQEVLNFKNNMKNKIAL